MSLTNAIVTVTIEGKNKEKFYANYPNIRTLQGFLKGQWDLSLFDSSFKGRNRLGDVDASIELNGHTLLVEFKGAKNGMNKGQVLKAIRQAKNSNIVTIFVFGARNVPSGYLKIAPDAEGEKGFTSSGYQDASLEEINELFSDWSRYTEANNLVESKTEEWNEVTAILAGLYQ